MSQSHHFSLCFIFILSLSLGLVIHLQLTPNSICSTPTYAGFSQLEEEMGWGLGIHDLTHPPYCHPFVNLLTWMLSANWSLYKAKHANARQISEGTIFFLFRMSKMLIVSIQGIFWGHEKISRLIKVWFLAMISTSVIFPTKTQTTCSCRHTIYITFN